MTVGELVAALKAHDPEMLVVVDGYGAGVDDLQVVKTAHIVRGPLQPGGIYGAHEIVDPSAWDFADEYGKSTVIEVVYLPRPQA